MKTVRITETFDGFPNGKEEVRFTKGDEPTLSNAFAGLIVGKGLAIETGDGGPDDEPAATDQNKDANA